MIYVFLAEGFEETEAITPIDMLRRCGKEVFTVGVTGKVVRGMPGTKNLAASKKLAQIIAYCSNNKIFMGAICAAPSVLGSMGLLNGKKAVCYPGFESALTGANVLSVPAVRDGNIITARGAGAALEFSSELISALIGVNAAEKMAGDIIWKT